jgi:AAA domain
MIDWLLEDHIKALIVDPYRYSHQVTENSNDDMGEVMKTWNRVAIEADCAVILVHHFTKGPGIGVDKTSGGHAIIAHSRAVLPLSTPLTEDEAEKYGITDHRHNYIRVDDPKVNFQPKPEHAVWFHLVEVPIYDKFTVVAAERWYPKPKPRRLSRPLPDDLADIVNKGPGGGEYYTQHRSGADDKRWFGHAVMEMMPDVDEKKAKALIDEWLDWGFLWEKDYTSPTTRRERKRLEAPGDQGRNG